MDRIFLLIETVTDDGDSYFTDHRVSGVFTSKRAAQTARRSLDKWRDFDIEEFPVDQLASR